MGKMTAALRRDDWLSTFLGKPAYHLNGCPKKFDRKDLPKGPCFVDAKIPVADIRYVSLLLNIGFKLVDTNIQMHRDAQKTATVNHAVRFADPAAAKDSLQVRKVAGDSFSFSRFHLDPDISDHTASRIKEAWAGNFFNGNRGQWMVVAEDKKEIAGFLQLLKKNDDQIVIDLIAVNQQSRGKGLASAMIDFAAGNCLGKPATMQVGTQVANFPSLQLYTRLGFRIVSSAYLFHLHLKG
jgi:ribosomal protein S18 acetylase RimI-like enzyme